MQVVRKNKLKCFVLLLSLALLIGVVAIAMGSDGSKVKRQLTVPPEPNAAARTYTLLSGIPQHGPILGFRSAPVTLQFFGDLQCRDSRQVMLGALPFLIRHWVRGGKLRIRFRSTESDTAGAGGWYEFKEQQTAAMAAGMQDKLWNFIDVFYREQGPEFSSYVDESFLNQIAVDAGLDLLRWSQDRAPAREAGLRVIEADERLAAASHLDGRLDSTPSFIIGRTGGPAQPLRHFSLQESQVFDEAIRSLL